MLKVLVAAVLGGWLNRARGGGWNPLKFILRRPITQIVLSLPYAYVVLAFADPYVGHTYAGILALECLILTTLAFLTGHGGGMDLGTYNKEREDEKLEFIIKGLRGKISEYWYDVLLLTVLGFATTLVCGLLTFNILIVISGLGKPLGYMLAKTLIGDRKFTWLGEVLSGAFLWGALALFA